MRPCRTMCLPHKTSHCTCRPRWSDCTPASCCRRCRLCNFHRRTTSHPRSPLFPDGTACTLQRHTTEPRSRCIVRTGRFRSRNGRCRSRCMRSTRRCHTTPRRRSRCRSTQNFACNGTRPNHSPVCFPSKPRRTLRNAWRRSCRKRCTYPRCTMTPTCIASPPRTRRRLRHGTRARTSPRIARTCPRNGSDHPRRTTNTGRTCTTCPWGIARRTRRRRTLQRCTTAAVCRCILRRLSRNGRRWCRCRRCRCRLGTTRRIGSGCLARTACTSCRSKTGDPRGTPRG